MKKYSAKSQGLATCLIFLRMEIETKKIVEFLILKNLKTK